ncbi:malonate transporter MadL [Siminovitchia terrae]|uniref:Malonate transporter MadL n=1 Tax=Siminovitchia terrae TaxID=1914933 RepID=A0A429XCK0_SIMTE|nr:malonate transporter subunit MadL [Siminovitchia terrae]RST61150.1 malonate transporter subunit MadL [Siminovitchia terrae]GIN93840.1 malonate transporter MadL [Siminovitchia terrae]GIN98014.1 malonate transporter MadL [Siminovitchia terrae]
MVIFGVALLAICMLSGVFLGELLGLSLGIEANVGGVGIAMLMLVLIVDHLKKRGKLSQAAQDGLGFWSAMYIPIVIAMSASQNVAGALDGGPLAIVAGVAAVAISWMVVPILSTSKREEVFDGALDENHLTGGEEINVRDIK